MPKLKWLLISSVVFLSLILFSSSMTTVLVHAQNTIIQNAMITQSPQNAQSPPPPRPINDPSQAYVAPATSRSVSSVSNTASSQPIPYYFNDSNSYLEKLRETIASNATMSQMYYEAVSNPNILMSNLTIAQSFRAANEETQKVIPLSGNGHAAWGTNIEGGYEGEIGATIVVYGGFAQEYISGGLNTAVANFGKTLFAPTFTLPVPCPLEVSTIYGAPDSPSSNTGHIGVFDFYLGVWPNPQATGPTNPINIFPIEFNNPTYIANVNSANPYYYVEIQYYPNTGDWYVYLWNFDINNWQIGYEETTGYLNRANLDGWDQFEAVYYDNTFAELNIVNPIQTANVMLDWGFSPSGISWNNAVQGSSFVDQISSDFWWQNTITPMSQVAYFAALYSNWIVRDPVITISAQDDYGYSVTAPVYIDGNFAGLTNSPVMVTQDVQHTVSIGSGTSILTWYYGGTEEFNTWTLGGYSDTGTINLCGTDDSESSWYYYTQ